MCHSYDDISLFVSLFDIPVSLGSLFQRIVDLGSNRIYKGMCWVVPNTCVSLCAGLLVTRIWGDRVGALPGSANVPLGALAGLGKLWFAIAD
jgi:hypothetical protein